MSTREKACYQCNDLKSYNKFHCSSDDPFVQVCDDCKRTARIKVIIQERVDLLEELSLLESENKNDL